MLSRASRLVCLCGLLWLVACSGDWPFQSGGYIDTNLSCTNDDQCKRYASEKVCKNGTCACPQTLTSCDAICVDTQEDVTHCGKCGNKCAAGAPCCAGKCCEQGKWCCDNSCVDLDVDNNNCGACGQKCGSKEQCCQGQCLNIDNDNQNCGGCGIRCSAAIKPVTLEKVPTKNGEELVFTFTDVQPPSNYSTITLKVDVYGAYADLAASAEIYINGVELGLLPGGSQCNQRPVPGHTKRFTLPKSALKDGRLEVKIELSDAVIVGRCSLEKVVATVSFGLDQCCSGSCVDVSENVEHCGACGNACTAGTTCCGNGCCPVGFDCCDGGCCRTLRREGDSPLTSVSARHDGKLLMIASIRGIWHWEFETGQFLGLLPVANGTSLFHSIAFHPNPPNSKNENGIFLAGVNKKDAIFSMLVGNLPNSVFQITSGLPQLTSPLTAFAWRADGKYFCIGDASGQVHILQAINLAGNAKTWQIAYTGVAKDLKSSILRLKNSRDGRWLAGIDESGKILIIEIGKLPNVSSLPITVFSSPPGTTLPDLALHPKGTQMAVPVTYQDPKQRDRNQIEIRDLNKSGFPILFRLQNAGNVIYMTYSHDGTRLAVGTIRGDIQIWDLEKKTVAYVFRGHKARIIQLLFHPDGKSLVSISEDRGIQIWALR